MTREPFKPDDIVKTCPKLESGMNLAVDGLRACTRGALLAPLFCTVEDLARRGVSREDIVEHRKRCIQMLNDDHSDIDCKRCLMVEEKRFGDLCLSKLGHLDLQHYSLCNLRCGYCSYARAQQFCSPQYDALAVLRLFSPEDVAWNAYVDFAGGEPTLLANLAEYLAFFKERRIRVIMHTNGVRYHQAIFDGLADGSIFWVATSVDAGTPATYSALRGGNHYLQVLENLCRYATAGSRGKGMLAVKYIFCDSNCGDDDIAGFSYAMLAIRPQKVWLNFDFTPLYLRDKAHDFTPQIEAYVKMYRLLEKHGLEPWHYFKEAVASFCREGVDIMDRVLRRLEEQRASAGAIPPDVKLNDFRNGDPDVIVPPPRFTTGPLMLRDGIAPVRAWSLENKRVILVPACPATQRLAADPEIQRAGWVGFVDRNPVQHGKTIDGRIVYGYEAMRSLEIDVVLVAAPEKHRDDILRLVARNRDPRTEVAEFDPCPAEGLHLHSER